MGIASTYHLVICPLILNQFMYVIPVTCSHRGSSTHFGISMFMTRNVLKHFILLQGNIVKLSTLLKEKPVALIWGHYTCPAYHGYDPEHTHQGSSYEDEYDLVSKYHEKIYFLHMVGPEPFPIWPYGNFDTGAIKMSYWSTIK